MKFTEEFWVLPFDLMYCSELKNSLISEQIICNWRSWGQWPWWPLESIPGTFASENILCATFQMLSSKAASRTFPPSPRVNTSMLSLALASSGLPVSGVKQDFPPETLPWPLSVWNRASVQDKMEPLLAGKRARAQGRGLRSSLMFCAFPDCMHTNVYVGDRSALKSRTLSRSTWIFGSAWNCLYLTDSLDWLDPFSQCWATLSQLPVGWITRLGHAVYFGHNLITWDSTFWGLLWSTYSVFLQGSLSWALKRLWLWEWREGHRDQIRPGLLAEQQS